MINFGRLDFGESGGWILLFFDVDSCGKVVNLHIFRGSITLFSVHLFCHTFSVVISTCFFYCEWPFEILISAIHSNIWELVFWQQIHDNFLKCHIYIGNLASSNLWPLTANPNLSVYLSEKFNPDLIWFWRKSHVGLFCYVWLIIFS